MADVTSVITNALSQANTYSQQASSMAQTANVAGQGYATMGQQQFLTQRNITVEKFAPDDKLGDSFRLGLSGRLGSDYESFEDQFEALMQRFYLYTDIDGDGTKKQLEQDLADYLSGVIQTGKLLPADAENQIWNRLRDRDAQESENLKQNVMNEFVSRGMFMPAGAMASRLLAVEIEKSKKASEANRDISIENYKLAIENQKFAVDRLISLRENMLRFVQDYLDLYFIRIPGKNVDIESRIAELNKSSWQAVAEYYRTLIAVESFKIDIDKFNSQLKFNTQAKDVDAFLSALQSRVNAAVSAANTLAAIAASYAGAQNSVTTLSDSTIRNQ